MAACVAPGAKQKAPASAAAAGAATSVISHSLIPDGAHPTSDDVDSYMRATEERDYREVIRASMDLATQHDLHMPPPQLIIAKNGSVDSMKQLLKFTRRSVAQVLSKTDELGRTGLHLAVLRGHVAMVTYLLSQLPSLVRSADLFGMTALQCADSWREYFAHRTQPSLAMAGEREWDLLLQPTNEDRANMEAVQEILRKAAASDPSLPLSGSVLLRSPSWQCTCSVARVPAFFHIAGTRGLLLDWVKLRLFAQDRLGRPPAGGRENSNKDLDRVRCIAAMESFTMTQCMKIVPGCLCVPVPSGRAAMIRGKHNAASSASTAPVTRRSSRYSVVQLSVRPNDERAAQRWSDLKDSYLSHYFTDTSGAGWLRRIGPADSRSDGLVLESGKSTVAGIIQLPGSKVSPAALPASSPGMECMVDVVMPSAPSPMASISDSMGPLTRSPSHGDADGLQLDNATASVQGESLTESAESILALSSPDVDMLGGSDHDSEADQPPQASSVALGAAISAELQTPESDPTLIRIPSDRSAATNKGDFNYEDPPQCTCFLHSALVAADQVSHASRPGQHGTLGGIFTSLREKHEGSVQMPEEVVYGVTSRHCLSDDAWATLAVGHRSALLVSRQAQRVADLDVLPDSINGHDAVALLVHRAPAVCASASARRAAAACPAVHTLDLSCFSRSAFSSRAGSPKPNDSDTDSLGTDSMADGQLTDALLHQLVIDPTWLHWPEVALSELEQGGTNVYWQLGAISGFQQGIDVMNQDGDVSMEELWTTIHSHGGDSGSLLMWMDMETGRSHPVGLHCGSKPVSTGERHALALPLKTVFQEWQLALNWGTMRFVGYYLNQ